ncbi:hypothetical protein CLM62_36995 [Streptomyces sp. SA15]|uniref:hypothetical protein n=1 Tax=Streptomyces sp. SA15 TaxID=934019 RepID=UPI000BB0560C|nr:hypothetical protein [Streptomyces sp. SA15]PAZ11159.1 hypothetical protein CLM62_36995 [Streptomyces sp. SA15]
MEETTRHPLALARLALGMTMDELVSGIRAAAARRGLRSGTDEARVRKWQRGVEPSEESQIYIAEALGWPADIVRAADWPTLAASLSQTVAWDRFDLGRHTHASQYWIAGLHNAHEAGDHDMGAGLLGDLACARPVSDLVPVRSAGVESKSLVRPLHLAGLTAAA